MHIRLPFSSLRPCLFFFQCVCVFFFSFSKSVVKHIIKESSGSFERTRYNLLFIASFFNKREGKALNISLKHPEDKMYSLKSEKKIYNIILVDQKVDI